MPKGIFKHRRHDPVIRFLAKTLKTKTCWLWKGAINNKGYGVFVPNYDKAGSLAHRFSYFKFVGPIGSNLVMHRCDVRNCVRPSHLKLGTAKDNTDDMMRKGRWVLPLHVAIKMGRERNRKWRREYVGE